MPKKSSLSGALTADEFEAAVRRHPLMKLPAIEAAGAVLLHGLSLEAAAKACGMTRQRVHAAASLLKRDQMPDNWQTATVTLPPKLMRQVLAMEKAAKRELEKKCKTT